MDDLSFIKKFKEFRNIFGPEIAFNSLEYSLHRDSLDKKYFEKNLSSHQNPEIELIDVISFSGAHLLKYNNFEILAEEMYDNVIKFHLKPEGSFDIEKSHPGYAMKFQIIKEEKIAKIILDKDISIYLAGFILSDFSTIIFNIPKNFEIHGTGERAFGYNLKNVSLALWNKDANGSYGPGYDPLYLSIPLIVGFIGSDAVMLFIDEPAKGLIEIKEMENYIQLKFQFEKNINDLTFYLLFGKKEEVYEKYSKITGKPYLPPEWAFGYHQSRYSYESQEEVLEIARKFKELDLPISAIHLDIDYMDGYRIFTVNKKSFPDMKKMSDVLRQMGIRLIGIIDPGVKWDLNYQVYNDGIKDDVFIKDFEGNLIRAPVWPGMVCFPDFSEPKVREWWGKRYKFFIDNGFSGVWHDMNEPAVFSLWGENTIPLSSIQSAGIHKEIHNLYGMQMVEAGYEGLKEYSEERPFILSRSGWAGIQKYSFVWTGDTESTWKEYRETVQTLLNLSLSGVPYIGVDIGGFSGNPSKELFIRWFQLGTFLPLFRNHSAKNTKRREPWCFDDETLKILRKFLKLRYKLIPYIFSIAKESADRGMPMIRPIDWYYAEHKEEGGFFLGEYILIYPVLSRNNSVSINLPPGRWTYFWDDSSHSGQFKREVSIDEIPVFIKDGSIIPMRDNDRITVHIYPGDAKFELYEDDGKFEPRFISLKMEIYNDTFKWENLGNETLSDFSIVVHNGGIKKIDIEKESGEIKIL